MSTESGPRKRAPSQKIGGLVRKDLIQALRLASRSGLATIWLADGSTDPVQLRDPVSCEVEDIFSYLSNDSVAFGILPTVAVRSAGASASPSMSRAAAFGWFGRSSSLNLRRFWASEINTIK